MFGQYPTPRGGIGNTTPRLPPISSPSLVNDQSALALLDQTYAIQANMQSITDERRARQMLEEQVRVITLVCKKLNQDIEALDTQLGERNVLLNSIEFRSNELQSNNISLNKDLQFKLARHDSSLSKLENESVGFNNILKELQNRQAEGMRTLGFRLNEIESRINDLNSKFDSILMEHTMVLKNVEGDTIKQLQMIDGKTRTMLEDVRSQMYQSKATQEAEMSRLESRLTLKIDDSVRNNEKFERLDRKFEEYSQSSSKRFMTIEEEFQRTLNRLVNSNEKLDHKINKTLEDRVLRSNNDYEKLKREMKIGFENIQDSILSLQNLIDGKIKLSEDRLEKEIEKIRKMVVLI